MKKALIATAVIAAGVTAYLYQQDSTSSNHAQVPQVSELAYVPADTLFFAGQLTRFPVKQYLTYFSPSYPDDLSAELELELGQSKEPAARFIASLSRQYAQAVASPDQFVETFGLAEQMKGLFYMVGLLPVLRYEIAQPDALWKMLEKAEQESGLVAKKEQLKGVDVTKYTLVAENDAELELVVSVNNGWATITANTNFNQPADLLQALAIEKPVQSLAQTDTLQTMTTQHQFDAKYLGFVNHVALINGLTGKDDNQFSQMLNQLGGNDIDVEMAELRTEACQNDFADIANHWPRTAFGTQKMVITDESVELNAKMVIESNSTVLKALASMRGFLPDFTTSAQNKIASIAFGIDAAKLSPAVTSIWTDFTEATYQCEPLVSAQQQIKQTNPMMLTMATSMATGVKGVSLSLLDFALSEQQGQPNIDKLDGIVTISAANPVALFNSVKSFYPPLMDVKLPADGSSIKLEQYIDLPLQLSQSLELAVKGEHLVLYRGQQAQTLADSLTNQALDTNGFSNLAVDYQAFFNPVFQFLETTGETIPPELEMLKEANMQLYFNTDFSTKGIEFSSELRTNSL